MPRGEQVLQVVAEQMSPSVADARGDRRGVTRAGAETFPDRREDELRVPKWCKRDEDRAAVGFVREETGELDREAGLTGATSPDDGQDTGISLVDERDRVEELLLTPDEPGGRNRELEAPGRT